MEKVARKEKAPDDTTTDKWKTLTMRMLFQ